MVGAAGVRARQMDLGHACAARIRDAFLGGGHNFRHRTRLRRPSRDALPGITGMYQESRAFLRRATEHLLSLGDRQFLYLGSGIPTIGHIHDVVRCWNDFRIRYLDNESLTAHRQLKLRAAPPAAPHGA